MGGAIPPLLSTPFIEYQIGFRKVQPNGTIIDSAGGYLSRSRLSAPIYATYRLNGKSLGICWQPDKQRRISHVRV